MPDATPDGPPYLVTHSVKFYRELWRCCDPAGGAIEDVITPAVAEVDVIAHIPHATLDVTDIAIRAALPRYACVYAAAGMVPRVVGWALACHVFHGSGIQRACTVVGVPGRRFADGAVLRGILKFGDDTTTLCRILTEALKEVR